MTPIRDTPSAFPRLFWVLVVGTFVNRTGLVVLPFLALFLVGERGFSVPAATVSVSLYGAGAFFGGLVGGWLSDRVGRRPVLLASLAGAAHRRAGGGDRPGGALRAGRRRSGRWPRGTAPAVSAAVADLVPETAGPDGGARRARAYDVVYWAINLGTAVGPGDGRAHRGPGLHGPVRAGRARRVASRALREPASARAASRAAPRRLARADDTPAFHRAGESGGEIA